MNLSAAADRTLIAQDVASALSGPAVRMAVPGPGVVVCWIMRIPQIHNLVFAILFSASALAQKSAAPPGAMAKVDGIFSRYNHTTTPGCAVGATVNGDSVISAGYGMADLEHNLAITPDSIFEAGSVSKQFTAAAVLLLAQQGKLSIDDQARKYIPELTDAASTVTVRNMLNHTAGLRDWGNVVGLAGWPRTTRVHTHAHVLEVVSRQRSLNYAPGSAYSYSNTGYNLAAILVSRVAGTPFATFSRETIFAPLGMTSTLWRDDFKHIVKNRAIAYSPIQNGFEMNMPFEDVHGNGGLLTTVGDLLRWNRNFTDPKVGGTALIEAQHQQAKLTDGRTIAYAAGLRIAQWKGRKEVSHSGATAGYRAWLGRYPEHKLSVAVLCNVTSANATQLGHDVAEIFLPPGAPATVPVTLDPAVLQSKAGLYRSVRDSETIRIAVRNGQLALGTRGVLKAIGADTFVAGEDGVRLTFESNTSGKPLRMHMGFPEDDDILYERVEPVVPSAADLQAFAGRYSSEEAEVGLRVEADGDGLVIIRRPDGKFRLTPTYQDAFSSELGSVRFLRDARGQVNEMTIGQGRVWSMPFSRVR